MVEQSEAERRVLEKIKVKMDKIKENQQKIRGPDFKEPTHHDIGKCVVLLEHLFLQNENHSFRILKLVFHQRNLRWLALPHSLLAPLQIPNKPPPLVITLPSTRTNQPL